MMDERDLLRLVEEGNVVGVKSEIITAGDCHSEAFYFKILQAALSAENAEMVGMLLSNRAW